ncbi:hypothetical protein GYMLUDRAFT_483135 [Collybiopsis luxurians FD-317 M1]|uniref:Uncharacterized protein n=1 Tax=Collybiopsis luxurians FD-317 M1 TaxID=944289 RepID=A0A0D0BGU4_9AGAR|nr:hypothetical protein GYMLUDRAFT_483135 [Collybiopsis luxurians FD-317 M1]
MMEMMEMQDSCSTLIYKSSSRSTCAISSILASMSTDLLDSKYTEFITSTVVPCTITTFFLYGLYSLLFCIYIQLQIRDSQSHRLGNKRRRPIFSRLSIPILFFLISLDVILSTVSLYEQLKS